MRPGYKEMGSCMLPFYREARGLLLVTIISYSHSVSLGPHSLGNQIVMFKVEHFQLLVLLIVFILKVSMVF